MKKDINVGLLDGSANWRPFNSQVKEPNTVATDKKVNAISLESSQIGLA
jgi:hypothetical protein